MKYYYAHNSSIKESETQILCHLKNHFLLVSLRNYPNRLIVFVRFLNTWLDNIHFFFIHWLFFQVWFLVFLVLNCLFFCECNSLRLYYIFWPDIAACNITVTVTQTKQDLTAEGVPDNISPIHHCPIHFEAPLGRRIVFYVRKLCNTDPTVRSQCILTKETYCRFCMDRLTHTLTRIDIQTLLPLKWSKWGIYFESWLVTFVYWYHVNSVVPNVQSSQCKKLDTTLLKII